MNSHEAIPNRGRTERDRRSDEQLELLDDDQVEMLDEERPVTTDKGTPSDRRPEPMVADKNGSPFDRPTDPGDDRWQQIQSDFVDDPRRSLSGAHDLIGELIDEIVRDLNREREGLSQQWSDDEVSTEDMRVCFQRYREFYHQLLFRSARSGWETKV